MGFVASRSGGSKLSLLFSRPSVLSVAVVAFLALYGALLAVPELHRVLGGVAYHLPPLLAVALTPRVIRRTTGAERAGWVCILVLLVTWDAGEWVYSYYSLVLRTEAPIPSAADAFYYAGYVAFSCALPLLARSGRGLQNQRSVVDAAIVVAVAGALFWWLVVVPGLPSSGASSSDYILVGYPLLDLGLFAALVFTFYGGLSKLPRARALDACRGGHPHRQRCDLQPAGRSHGRIRIAVGSRLVGELLLYCEGVGIAGEAA